MRAPAWGLGLAVLSVAAAARAATFDARGVLEPDADAVVTESFEDFQANEVQLDIATFFEGKDPVTEDGALHGDGWVRFGTNPSNDASFEIDLPLPREDGAYEFRLWVRHGRVWSRAIFEYETEREDELGYMFPSGRVTSDGWVELVSNPVSVTGSELSRAFIRLDGAQIDLDAIEVVRKGTYDGASACLGAFDPVCGDEAVCMSGFCRQGDRFVPPLPDPQHRAHVADYLMGRVRWLFGGHFTRTQNMPAALEVMERMKTAETPWQFWSSFARGVRMLGDWHTSASSAISFYSSSRRLAVCFIEGRADLTQTAWPSDPTRADLLVSHVQPNPLGIERGDRLVAVDGQHPIDWARSLEAVHWGHHPANDPDVDAEFAEALRGLIATFARTFSVLHCDAATSSCDSVPTTYAVEDIPEGGGFGPACDNRPMYHQKNPPPSPFGGGSLEESHFHFSPWLDEIVDSAPGENILGMTWDNLSPNFTPFFLSANETFKQSARGVILDHRAGNGGTIDAPQAITQLVRPPTALSAWSGFGMSTAGFDGPFTPEEGVALYEQLSLFGNSVFTAGSTQADTDLPVALLIHRDGSASDWLPHGMKGAPKVRIFGPHETAGAFSSFYQYSYWSRLSFQLASGDTIRADGKPLIGCGVEPDVIVEHTQTSLLQGKDAPYEAALQWVRENLK